MVDLSVRFKLTKLKYIQNTEINFKFVTVPKSQKSPIPHLKGSADKNTLNLGLTIQLHFFSKISTWNIYSNRVLVLNFIIEAKVC